MKPFTSSTKYRNCKPLAFFLYAFLTIPGAAQAYSISLIPSTTTPNVGAQVTFDLRMDFTGETTVGGGIDIVYTGFTDGNGLRYVGYTPIGTAAEYTSPDGLVPTPQADRLLDIAFGYPLSSPNWGNDLPFDPGITVGTLIFDVLTVGHYTLSVAETTDPNGTAGFYSSTNGSHLSLANVPVSVDAQAPGGGGVALPLPGTLWLMLGGLPLARAFSNRLKAA